MNGKGHAVAILVVSPQGIPLVRDPKKPSPIFWKLPGGRGDATETAETAAIRELAEEVGINATHLEKLYAEDRGTHTFTLFRLVLSSLPSLKSVGNEGEEIRLFPKDQLGKMEDFFPPHQKVLRQLDFLNSTKS